MYHPEHCDPPPFDPDYQTATEIDLERKLQRIKRHEARSDLAQLKGMFVPLPVLKEDFRADFAIGLHDITTRYQTSFTEAIAEARSKMAKKRRRIPLALDEVESSTVNTVAHAAVT